MFPGECRKYRWSKFKNLGSADEMYETVMNGVFPFIKNLHRDGDSAYSRYMGDAISYAEIFRIRWWCKMGMMTVYHGGYQVVDKPKIRKGRNTKDFGTGFYCTIIKEQAHVSSVT